MKIELRRYNKEEKDEFMIIFIPTIMFGHTNNESSLLFTWIAWGVQIDFKKKEQTKTKENGTETS